MLSVFDILGREITNLVNEVKEPGVYQVELNASSYPTGIYFLRMTAGKFTELKKLMLIK